MLSCHITQELPALTDMYVPTLTRMLNVLQLLVLDLCELLQILYFIHSALRCNRTLIRRVNTDYSELIVYRLNAIAFSQKIPEPQTKTILMRKTLRLIETVRLIE